MTAEEFLEREGYRRCDMAACNCGLWHQHREPAVSGAGLRAWQLIERKNGTDRTIGIALTNEAASAWVHSRNMEFGEARSAMPIEIVSEPAAPPPGGSGPA